jgi:cobalt-zinc-cadmium efflux system outer membrane protein
MKKTSIALIFAAVALALAGCASPRERQGFDDLRMEERRSYERSDVPVLDDDSTLADYILYAAANNPGLEAAFNRWKAAVHRIPQARALPDPRFSYTHFIRSIETRSGAIENWFRLGQTFPWLSKLTLRRDVATEAAKAAQSRYEAERLKLFFSVKDAYYEHYYRGRAVRVLEENVQLVKYLESVARAKFSTGGAEHSDVIRAQVELGQLEDRLRTLVALRKPIVARLNAALNRPTDAPLPVPKEIAEESVVAKDDDIIAALKSNSPELQALTADAARERAAIDLAKKNYYPDITLQGELIGVREASPPRPSSSGEDPVAVTVALNIPIWYGKYSAQVKEAVAGHIAATKGLHDRENQLTATLQLALYNFRDAGRKIRLYRDALLPKARQSLKVTQQGFEAAKVDFLDLIDAERTLLEFELSYERALVDRAQRLAEIEMLIGRPLPRSEEEQPAPNGN